MDAIQAVREKARAVLDREDKEHRAARLAVEARLVAGELVDPDELLDVVGHEGRAGVEALLARAEQKRELAAALEQLKGWGAAEEHARGLAHKEAEARAKAKKDIAKIEARVKAARSEWRTAQTEVMRYQATLDRLSVKGLPAVLKLAREPYNEARVERDRAHNALEKAKTRGASPAEIKQLGGAFGLAQRKVSAAADAFGEHCEAAIKEHVGAQVDIKHS